MFKIYIHTEQEYLGLKLIEQIKLQIPVAEVKLYIERTWAYELSYASNCIRSQLQVLQTLIFPLVPKRRLNDSLSDQECHLYLGHSRPLNEFKIHLKTDHETLQSKLDQTISKCFKTQSKLGTPTQSVLKFGGAPPFIYEFLYWLVYQETQVPLLLEKVWDDDEDDLHLFIQDPKLRGESFRHNLKLFLYFDEDQTQENGQSISQDSRREGLMSLLESQLRHKGYQPQFMIQACKDWPNESITQGFLINPIDFSLDLDEANLLIEVLQTSLKQCGYDYHDHPVSVKSFRDLNFLKYQEQQADKFEENILDKVPLFVYVYLPILQISQHRIYPVSGQSKQRWAINIYHDQLLQTTKDVESSPEFYFSKQLTQRGFTRLNLSEQIPKLHTRVQGGIYIDWGSAVDYPIVKAEFIDSFKDVSFYLPIIEESSDVSRNTIELTYFSNDLDQQRWTQTLKKACHSISLSIILNANEPYIGLSNIIKYEWQNIEIQSHYEYVNSNKSYALDDSEDDDLSDESWSFDESSNESSEEWEQSELQDWLMSSLHEQDSYQQADICILYGACPRFVIEWLKSELEQSFKHEIDTQNALSADDWEVIIEFAPHFDPKESAQITLSSSGRTYQSAQAPKNETGTIGIISNNNQQMRGLIEAPQLTKKPEQKEQQKASTLQKEKLLYYPYFTRLCEHLNTAIQQSESVIIQAPKKSGISTAFRWCSIKNNALLISPNDLMGNTQLSAHKHQALNQLKRQRNPLVLVDRYDLFSDEVKIQINRALMGLGSDQQSKLHMPMMILNVGDQCTLNDLRFVHQLKLIQLAQPSVHDWQELLWSLFEQEHQSKTLRDNVQIFDIVRLLSKVHERVHNTLTETSAPPILDSFMGVLGVQRIISHLKDDLLRELIQSTVPESDLVQLQKSELISYIKKLYTQNDLGEYYSLIQLDDLW